MDYSNNSVAQETTPVSLQCGEITSNLNKTPTAKFDSKESDVVTIIQDKKVVKTKNDKSKSLKKSKKIKIFTRRKDVIIKTLLRKCRKFFLKDFSTKTNYLKTAKRKYGSSVYKIFVESYLNTIFVNNQSEDLLIFMAAFLYP